MMWDHLERWKTRVQLSAVAAGDRDATTTRVRDAFGEAGAWITDVHFFSGVQTAFTFEVVTERVRALERELVRAGLAFDDASRAQLANAANAQGDVEGTLVVVFARGDPDITHEVPSVPG
jgi:hypothetical protein